MFAHLTGVEPALINPVAASHMSELRCSVHGVYSRLGGLGPEEAMDRINNFCIDMLK